MNEKIKELLLRDGLYDCLLAPYTKNDGSSSLADDLQILVERTVAECIGVVCQALMVSEGITYNLEGALNKHFGIEQKKWVGFTDDERIKLVDTLNLGGRFQVLYAIEAQLKERNS